MADDIFCMDETGQTGASAKAARRGLTRRRLLQAGAATLAMPAVFGSARASNGEVIVRSPGGALGEAAATAIYEPFTQETGITVVPVPTSVGKLYAMQASGNIEIDLVETSAAQLIDFDKLDALLPVDYDGFRYTDPEDLEEVDRSPNHVTNYFFSTVLAYNSQHFAGGHPGSWAEFWDVEKFPGSRVLQDIASGELPLEFALLADGVAVEDLYPLDVDRAFRSLDRIKAHVISYFSSAAPVTQMLATGEAAAAAIWNGHAQANKDAGGVVDIEWNQGMLAAQGMGILKGAVNVENARKLMDFALRPESQAAIFSRQIRGPSNRKALELMSPEVLAKVPNSAEHMATGFRRNALWWNENLEKVGQRWAEWRLT